MFCSGLTTTLLLAATCLLMAAGVSRAQMSGGYDDRTFERVITCDGAFNVQRLSCGSGVIDVQSALYGRADSEICSEDKRTYELSNTKCSRSGTLDVIKKKYDGKKVCELNTNRFILDSFFMCFGTYKYLDTTYTCDPASGYQVIFVLAANYGRHDSTTCSYQRSAAQVRNVDCSRPSNKVAERCNGKSSCTIKASNSVFGDPCGDTYKYLEVTYKCLYRFMWPDLEGVSGTLVRTKQPDKAPSIVHPK